MNIIVHPHARIHGLTDRQIASAYASGANGAIVRQRDKDQEPTRWATIGIDDDGHFIELVFVRMQGGDILIIHANLLTKAFRNEIRKEPR